MRSFSELSPIEKVALTREELEPYIQFACMEQGIEIPVEPVYQKVPEVKVNTVTIYKLSIGYYETLAVTSLEDAQTIMSLPSLVKTTTSYDAGSIEYVVEEGTSGKLSITPFQVVPAGEWVNVKKQLVEKARIEKENENLRKNFEEALERVAEVRRSIISDWTFAKASKDAATRKFAKWKSYFDMADRNATVAFSFFKQICGYDEAQDIISWNPVENEEDELLLTYLSDQVKLEERDEE